ncbi:MAG: type I pullulanase [Ruminococcus sp.]|nr:type I pullulanase [Ruminococcus sp.]
MKTMKRLLALVLTLLMVLSIATVGTFAETTEETPDAEPTVSNEYSAAAMALDDEYAYSGTLGAIYTPQSTEFKVWAPTASRVVLNLYATGSDSEEGAADLGSHEMSKLNDGDKFTGVWTVTVKGDLKNVYYTYSITSPDRLVNGVETTRETQDVYSYAIGVNSARSMVVDLDSTDPANWEKDPHIYVDDQTDAVIWELQVKDFSYNPNSGVSEANRGKYLAFTEEGTTLNGEGKISTCVDYLKTLGVTHVQINPFYDFGSIDETGDDTQYNWGYDPMNYGVPEGSFSSNPYDGNVRINECKQMIQALHEAGIGVIMDVVYNHTYKQDSCFTAVVPDYYYRINADGTFSNQSGCGNDTASERYMYRRYMMDMLQYWVDEYHIDGYRFDLMGIHDVETMNLIRDMLDKTDERIIMYGEGWSGNTTLDPESCTGEPVLACTQRNANVTSERIGFFNDQMRDALKGGVFDGPTAPGWLSGSMVHSPGISYGIRANTIGKGCNWNALAPEQCVSYASCHDNNTLYDKLVGINFGMSADYRDRYDIAIAQNKLSSAITLSSQGINLILAGEEMARSKDGDENSYSSSPTLNMIDWSLLETNADLVSYYKGMMELRSVFSPFTAAAKDDDDDTYKYNFHTSMAGASKTIAYTVDNTAEGEWSKVAVMFNGSKGSVNQELKTHIDKGISADTEWVIIANDKSAGIKKLGEVKGLKFQIPAFSSIIAVEKSTYEACAIDSKFSTVSINHIDNTTGKSFKTNTILGMPGEGYIAPVDTSIPLKYEIDTVEGDVEGKFAEEDTDVNYYFKRFTPSSLEDKNGDIDGDGVLSIMDATAIQLHLALVEVLDDEVIARGDYNYDTYTSVMDATLLQQFLALEDVTVYTLTVNYVDEEGKAFVSPLVKEYRLGEEYTTEAKDSVFYELKETPANANGVITGNVTVTYQYTYKVDSVKVHVKHDGDLTWDPFLWAWATPIGGGTQVNMYEAWPGLQMTEVDENGWYTTELDVPPEHTYSIIINNGGGIQTSDYDGFSAGEIWVVINDAEATKTGSWISVYGDAELTEKLA